MKIKRIPRYLLVILLALGASIVLGFLSFAGMYALFPILGLAIVSLVLAMAYEGQIYFQNIDGALNKLFFHRNWVRERLANDYLLSLVEIYEEERAEALKNDEEPLENEKESKVPEFVKTYSELLNHYLVFKGKKLTKTQKIEKKRVTKMLHSMEKSFEQILFKKETDEHLLNSEKTLKAWLMNESRQKKLIKKLKTRTRIFYGVLAFSIVTGIFMGVGSTWLLMEGFAALPVLATLSPAVLAGLIVPMAIVAGVAYGLLIYNALTDMIQNESIQKCLKVIQSNFQRGLSFKGLFKVLGIFTLLSLAMILTLCTAGTWWTVVKSAPPLFAWLNKLPSFIMTIINPVITGIAALVFSVENMFVTLGINEPSHHHAHEHHDDSHEHGKNFFVKIKDNLVKKHRAFKAREETLLQRINPFRIFLKITIEPLKTLGFFGHIISISVTSDRVPGIPAIFSAGASGATEFIEDWHYFQKHHHHANDPISLARKRLSPGHNHSHDDDIPTFLIKLLFSPVYLLSTLWAWGSSKRNKNEDNKLSFKEAWGQQFGKKVKRETLEVIPQCPENTEEIHANYRLRRAVKKHGDTKQNNLEKTRIAVCETNDVHADAVQDCLKELLENKSSKSLTGFFEKSPKKRCQEIFPADVYSTAAPVTA